jgi:hypothetical protein
LGMRSTLMIMSVFELPTTRMEVLVIVEIICRNESFGV